MHQTLEDKKKKRFKMKIPGVVAFFILYCCLYALLQTMLEHFFYQSLVLVC